MCSEIVGKISHIIQQWGRHALCLQPCEVERHREKGAPVDISQMSSRQVSAAIAIASHYFNLSSIQRKDLDVRRTHQATRKQNSFPAWENLRPGVRYFALLQPC